VNGGMLTGESCRDLVGGTRDPVGGTRDPVAGTRDPIGLHGRFNSDPGSRKTDPDAEHRVIE